MSTSIENDANYVTSELYDINNDGYLDLIYGGHEFEGADIVVRWGNYTGKYLASHSTIIPKISSTVSQGYGLVIDFDFLDLDGDGDQEVLLNRTGDPNTGKWYWGHYLQLISFDGFEATDVTDNYIMDPEDDNIELIWLRFHDMDGDGDKDIVVENKQDHDYRWENNGNFFTRIQ